MYVTQSAVIPCTCLLLSNRPVGAQVGHACPVVNWTGLIFNMANRQKFREGALLVSAFLLLDINFKDLISDLYLTSLQLVLCRVAAVKCLPVHQS